MVCKKCGSPIPIGAQFCGECGWHVENEKTDEIIALKLSYKRLRVITAVLLILCLALAAGWAFREISTRGHTDRSVPASGTALYGRYIVGEDSELPEGRYNISPVKGSKYMSIYIYDNVEDSIKKYDEEYRSLAIDDIFYSDGVTGYKLRDGNVIVIDEPGAIFEKSE